MPAPPCAPGCGCGKHSYATLTKADIAVLTRVFGFASVEEFGMFVRRMDADA